MKAITLTKIETLRSLKVKFFFVEEGNQQNDFKETKRFITFSECSETEINKVHSNATLWNQKSGCLNERSKLLFWEKR
jgi:hypothetical protein